MRDPKRAFNYRARGQGAVDRDPGIMIAVYGERGSPKRKPAAMLFSRQLDYLEECLEAALADV